MGESTTVRFNQTLDNYPKDSVRSDTYNLTKHKKIQIIETTKIKLPNTGSDLLYKRNIECDIKNNDSKVGNFITSTRTNSPTGCSVAFNLPPIGSALRYIETSSINHSHERVFVSFERPAVT